MQGLARVLSFRSPAAAEHASSAAAARRNSRKASPTSLTKYAAEDHHITEEDLLTGELQVDWMGSSKSHGQTKVSVSEYHNKKLIRLSLLSTKELGFVILSVAIAVILAAKAVNEGLVCQQQGSCSSTYVVFVYIFLAVALLVVLSGAAFTLVISRAQQQWRQLDVLHHHASTSGSSKAANDRLLRDAGPAIDLCARACFLLFTSMLLFFLILSHFAGLCDDNSAQAFASLCLERPLGGGFFFIAPVLAQATVRNLPLRHVFAALVALFVTTVATASGLLPLPAFRNAFFQWVLSLAALTACSLALHSASIDAFSLYTSVRTKAQELHESHALMQNEVFNHKIDLALMYEILPPEVVESLREGVRPEAKRFDIVTVFFSDIVGFTDISSQCEETKVMEMLNDLYTVMDYVTSVFDLYKVETIGDAYMVTGGTKDDQMEGTTHAKLVAAFAVIVRQVVAALIKSPIDQQPVRIRIGLHSGPTVAGVVGSLMPRYCLFGDTINTASRMESNGEPGRIHISGRTADILKKDPSCKFVVTERGEIQIKGKGLMTTYWIDGAMEDNEVCNEAAVQNIQSTLERMLARDRNSRKQKIVPIQRGASTRTMGMGQTGTLNRMMSSSGRALSDSPSSPVAPVNVTPYRMSLPGTIREDGVSVSGTRTREELGLSSPKNLTYTTSGSQSSASRPSFLGSLLQVAADIFNRGRVHAHRGRDQDDNDDPDLENYAGNSLHNSRLGHKPGLEASTSAASKDDLMSMRRTMKHASSVRDVESLRLLCLDEDGECARLEEIIKAINPTWTVEKASSGEMALKKCKACKFLYDVIFVADFTAAESELQGHEVVALMRAQEQKEVTRKHCIVVGLCRSGSAAPQSSRAFLAAGADEIWNKPFPAIATVQTVLLDLWKSRRAGTDRKIQTWSEEKAP